MKLFAISYVIPGCAEPADCCAVAAASRDHAITLVENDPRIDLRWDLIAKPVNADVRGPERVLWYGESRQANVGAAL